MVQIITLVQRVYATIEQTRHSIYVVKVNKQVLTEGSLKFYVRELQVDSVIQVLHTRTMTQMMVMVGH